MRTTSSFASLIFIVILGIGGGLAYATYSVTARTESICIGVIAFVIAVIASLAIRVADQWDKAVILRLGKFHALKGPGLFFIFPVIDAIPYWIDTRVITSGFKAEKTLTKDTVPVDVDAVLFWKVVDSKKAALDVADYQAAISWASQTALRDVIGKTMLCDMLEGRDKISALLQKIIDERTEPWGINVISVEVKDVLIPQALENAMSMQAQAERERQARVILGDSERQVAEKFGEAAKTYQHNPVAFHLRAMNAVTVTNWALNLVVAVTFLTLVGVLGHAGTFWLYGVIAIGAWVFFYLLVPETKGKTLEQIGAHWRAGEQPREL
ncbi:MAG TPA: SPFH domain-containing protein [Tepidisphaeraceae bacterium]|nr:SPFH domain-containing protein [Tepidisphaeraceae bacterium]